jgi:hypothetical protein
MSYGPDVADMFWRAPEFVDQILHGAKLTNLPIQQPTKFQIDDQPKDRESNKKPRATPGLKFAGRIEKISSGRRPGCQICNSHVR